MVDLLPCPFCEGEASLGEDECVHDVVFAFCTRCAAQGPFDPDKDLEEAALLWNKRAQTPSGEPT